MAQTLAPDTSVARVGHYELRQCLGEGGYGQVYEAWDQMLYRSVALKCLTITSCEPGRDQLISEARLAASSYAISRLLDPPTRSGLACLSPLPCKDSCRALAKAGRRRMA